MNILLLICPPFILIYYDKLNLAFLSLIYSWFSSSLSAFLNSSSSQFLCFCLICYLLFCLYCWQRVFFLYTFIGGEVSFWLSKLLLRYCEVSLSLSKIDEFRTSLVVIIPYRSRFYFIFYYKTPKSLCSLPWIYLS